MKIYQVFLLVLSLFGTTLVAQNTSGVIEYEDKIDIHKSLPEHMEEFKDRIPQYRTSEKILYFNAEEALYTNPPADETEENKPREFRGEGRGMRFRMGGRADKAIFYTNFNESTSLDSRDIFGKKFLIEGEREKLNWKVTAEQKQVGSYLCLKAVYQDSTQNLEVWFTPMIPVSTGPGEYFGLPGLILHIDIDEGKRTITAKNIELKALEEDLIVKPTEGKKVTDEEFKKIQEEKIKEREAEFGGRRGQYMIRRG